MKRAVIFSGGAFEKPDWVTLPKDAVILCADSGLRHAKALGISPDWVLGDFDSSSEQPEGESVLRYPPEKDDTDTQSTLNLAIRRGAKNILILGATGGRLDHFIGNMGLLGYGRQKGVNVILADAQNYICLVENGHIIRKDSQFGKYVSFFAAGETVEGLTLKGFKYPLDHYRLTTDNCGRT